MITAGIPCQPFSQAGNKKGRDDERYMWPVFRGLINRLRPNFSIIENVPAIIPMELDNIIADLENDGYTSLSYILPACAANAPHRRDRIWIIAYLDGFGTHKWFDHRLQRYIQEDIQRNMAQIQQEWALLKPNAWSTYTARDWLNYNTRASRANDGTTARMDKNRTKALGNAIVPQVIYPILEFIKVVDNASKS